MLIGHVGARVLQASALGPVCGRWEPDGISLSGRAFSNMVREFLASAKSTLARSTSLSDKAITHA